MPDALRIDLNADLGEGFGHWTSGDDAAMLGLVTSANIACGFHAGDPAIMRRSCELAVAGAVVIGAQVGYRDLVGFGRRPLRMARDALSADVLYQLGALDAFAREAGDRVRYLKPHGALYHAAATDPEAAGAVVDALLAWPQKLAVLTLPGSMLAELASVAGLPVFAEAFADRNYLNDGSLVPRDQPEAVLTDPDLIADRALRLVTDGRLSAVDASVLPIAAHSLCVHGDTPGAVRIARSVREALTAAGVELRSFLR